MRWPVLLLPFAIACGGAEALLPADPIVVPDPMLPPPQEKDPIELPGWIQLPDLTQPVVADDLLPPPPPIGTRHPLVLVHGFLASGTALGFEHIGEDLESRDFTVLVADLSSAGAPSERAVQLAEQIDALLAETGAAKVNIIAHSMGGLDARYLIATLGYGDRVATLSTISTPHRGSQVADQILSLTAGTPDPLIEAFSVIWGRTVDDIDEDPDLRAALEALRTTDAAAFNAANPDDPRVRYRSWAGLSDPLARAHAEDETACEQRLLFDPAVRDRLSTLFVATAWWAGDRLAGRPNDGMVAVESAKWGEFVGCLAADHADEIGALAQPSPDPVTGFDHLALYREIAAELRADGY